MQKGGEGMRKRLLCLTGVILASVCLSGCQQKDPEPGELAGYDEGKNTCPYGSIQLRIRKKDRHTGNQ